jgi:tol-pal system protein YbgF
MNQLKLLSVSACAACLIGCAATAPQTESQSLLPEIDIVKLKDDCEEALKLAQDARMDVQVVNTKVASIDNRISVIGDDASNVSQARIEDIENRIAMLTEAIKDLQQQAGVTGRTQKARPAKPQVPETPTFSPTGASAMVAGNENELYQTALKAFNDRSYNQSLKLFESLLQQYPGGPYTGNAQYWVGEIQYAQGQYAKAVAAFDKVISSGESPKSDDAQLKIGMSYMKLGKKTQAKEALSLLVNQYPNSEYVSRARKYLEELR